MTQDAEPISELIPELTMVQMLQRRARQTPTATALRQKDYGIWQPISWRNYWERARDVAAGLLKLGLSDGGHVGILCENRCEWVIAQFGIGAAGGIAVGVYPTSPTPEVAYVLGHADVEIVICEDQEQTDKVMEALPNLPKLKFVVVIDMKGLRGYADARILSFEALAERGRDTGENDTGESEIGGQEIDRRVAAQALDQVALMVYTSGSTGKPKGAMITWRNLRAEAAGIIERLGSGPHSAHLSYLPLCHVAEQMFTTMGPLYGGGQVNFGESLRTVQEDLREVAPTSFLGVPRIWEKLHSAIHIKTLEAGGWRRWLFERAIAACEPFAEVPPADRNWRQRVTFRLYYLLIFRALQNFIGLRRVQVAVTGAAPISPQIVRFFRTIGIPLLEVYGLTETTGMVTGQAAGRAPGQTSGQALPGSVGAPILGAECRVGPDGELLVRGDVVFAGYYKNEEATRRTLRDGWLHTGDVVEEQQGQYRIVDRLKDIMITAGGKNLSPSEIEKAVKASPFIKECIVIGEGRKFVSALIQIESDTVGKWAEEQRIVYTNFRSLAENPQIRELVQAEVDRANAGLTQVARVRSFHLLTKELDHDDDEVTATMKVRRSNINAKYQAEITALYA
ncbi:AMP-dependent synthetase/ligase [Algihabitans albus]|uniref:AMP-dependent synthetase/ligase n=1 Tax=Algihabitans albus TaxID=2164067 RepID=UPI001F3B637E|nr:AMP-binding protein [Algihabitans albus]